MQTSGGLLVSVDSHHAKEFEILAAQKNLPLTAFGRFTEKQDHVITVK